MNAASFLRYVHLAYFARPAAERVLFRAIRRQRPARIVEIGLGLADRAQRMIAVAGRYLPPDKSLHYAGIDLFEGRDAAAPGTTLKRAHRLLKASGAAVRLAPGDPFSALARTANALTGTDLLVVSADQDSASLERAWFYVPRMLHPTSLVFVERRPNPQQQAKFEQLTALQIEQFAAAAAPSRSRAA